MISVNYFCIKNLNIMRYYPLLLLLVLSVFTGCRDDDEPASLFDNMEVFPADYCNAGVVDSVGEQTVRVEYLGLAFDWETTIQRPMIYVIFNCNDLSQEYTVGQLITFVIKQRRVVKPENDKWERWYCKVEDC